MSAVTHPRGPLPPRVYWTRRLVLVAVAFALVFGVARLLGSGGGGTGPSAEPVGADVSPSSSAPTTSADPTPSEVAVAPTVSSSPTATTTTTPTATSTSKGKKGKASASATPLPSPSGPCADDDIVVTPTIKNQAYAGEPVVFAMNLTTKTSPACDWTVSASSLVVKVTSGSDRIWSTQDCTGAVPKESVVVRKDTPTTVNIAWNGQRSDADCTRTTSWAEPGYYHAVAAAFGSEPVDEQFRLLKPTRPTVTASPRPDHRASKSTGPTKAATTTAKKRH